MTNKANSNINVLLPLQGKMAGRSFLNNYVVSIFNNYSISLKILCIDENFKYGGNCEIHYVDKDDFKIKYIFQLLKYLRSLCGDTQVVEFRKRTLSSNKKNYLFDVYLGLCSKMSNGLKYLINKIFSRIEFQFIINNKSLQKYLDNIDAVIIPGVGNFGFDFFNPLILYSRGVGIPVVGYIPNYDNLVMRGLKGFCPDLLSVWSEKMAQCAIEFQRLPKKTVSVTGSILYDIYHYYGKKYSSKKMIDEVKDKYGLSKHKKTILYAFGENNNGNELLTSCLAYNFSDVNIVVRFHPSERLSHSILRSKIDEILVSKTRHYYISDKNKPDRDKYNINETSDIIELIEMLSIADCVVDHYSTIALESSLFCKPVVEISYDNFVDKNLIKRKMLHNLPHNRSNERYNAVYTVNSKEELCKVVRSIVNEENCVNEEYLKKFIDNEVGFFDGKSTDRFCNQLISLVGKY